MPHVARCVPTLGGRNHPVTTVEQRLVAPGRRLDLSERVARGNRPVEVAGRASVGIRLLVEPGLRSSEEALRAHDRDRFGFAAVRLRCEPRRSAIWASYSEHGRWESGTIGAPKVTDAPMAVMVSSGGAGEPCVVAFGEVGVVGEAAFEV